MPRKKEPEPLDLRDALDSMFNFIDAKLTHLNYYDLLVDAIESNWPSFMKRAPFAEHDERHLNRLHGGQPTLRDAERWQKTLKDDLNQWLNGSVGEPLPWEAALRVEFQRFISLLISLKKESVFPVRCRCGIWFTPERKGHRICTTKCRNRANYVKRVASSRP